MHLQTAAGLLLLFHAFHLASFQHSTRSPVITIDKSWLRRLAENRSASANDALVGGELEYDERGQPPAGIPSGGMAIFNIEEENSSGEGSGDEVRVVTTGPPDVTFAASEPPDGNVSSTSNVGDDSSESNQANNTDTTEVPENPTALAPRNDSSDLNAKNDTSAEDHGNHTDATTASPQQEVTEESTATAAQDWNATDDSTAMVPEAPKATTAGSAATVDQTETTAETPRTSPEASPAVDPNTPEGTNKTGKVVADGSSSERGRTASACRVQNRAFLDSV